MQLAIKQNSANTLQCWNSGRLTVFKDIDFYKWIWLNSGLLKASHTCYRAQYPVSRWSRRGSWWRWHSHTPLGSSAACSRSTPAGKHVRSSPLTTSRYDRGGEWSNKSPVPIKNLINAQLWAVFYENLPASPRHLWSSSDSSHPGLLWSNVWKRVIGEGGESALSICLHIKTDYNIVQHASSIIVDWQMSIHFCKNQDVASLECIWDSPHQWAEQWTGQSGPEPHLRCLLQDERACCSCWTKTGGVFLPHGHEPDWWKTLPRG